MGGLAFLQQPQSKAVIHIGTEDFTRHERVLYADVARYLANAPSVIGFQPRLEIIGNLWIDRQISDATVQQMGR
jgi:hypothetical protein